MNTYVCGTKPLGNKKKIEKKTKVIAVIATKGSRKKSPGQDLCLKCCLSCRPMKETTIGCAREMAGTYSWCQEFSQTLGKAEKGGEKRGKRFQVPWRRLC